MTRATTEVGATRFYQLVEAVRHALDRIDVDGYHPPDWVRDASGTGVYAGPYTVELDDPLGIQQAQVPLEGYAAIPDAATRLERALMLISEQEFGEDLVLSEPLAFIDLSLAGRNAPAPREAASTLDRNVTPMQAEDMEKLSQLLDQEWPNVQADPSIEQLAILLPRLVDAMAREHDLRTLANEVVTAKGTVSRILNLIHLETLYFDHTTEASRIVSLYSLRFLRNMVVAGGERMQHRVLGLSLKFRQTALLRLTSGAIVENDEEVLLARAFAQLLANCTTRCEGAQAEFWRIVFPSAGESTLLQRLMEMNDTKVAMAVRVLLLNCVVAQTHGGAERAAYLAQAAPAHPVVRILLHGSHRTLESLVSAEEVEASQSSAEGEELLQLDHAVLKALFQRGLLGSILSWLGSDLSTEQVALLKFFDAYLDAGAVGYGTHVQPDPVANLGRMSDASALWDVWLCLSGKMRDLLLSAPGAIETDKRSEMVALHQALVLVLQIFCAFIYPAQQGGETDSEGEESLRPVGRWLVLQFSTIPGAVEDVVALLEAVSKFSPAISPFKGNDVKAESLPEGHALSHTGRTAQTQPNENGADLPYLKRDLLRLITGLAFLPPRVSEEESQRVKEVQDRVHQAGGLWTVLNLTPVDVANPYIREHAILALSTLLKHNLANQHAVAQLQPQEVDRAQAWDGARRQALERMRD